MEGKESFPRRVIKATRLFIDRVTPRQLRGVNVNQGEKGLRAQALGINSKEVEILDILEPIPTKRSED